MRVADGEGVSTWLTNGSLPALSSVPGRWSGGGFMASASLSDGSLRALSWVPPVRLRRKPSAPTDASSSALSPAACTPLSARVPLLAKILKSQRPSIFDYEIV
jgi:hypothetical protein